MSFSSCFSLVFSRVYQEEYEAARTDLLQEVARGTSVEELRAKLTKKDDHSKGPVVYKSKIPDELVQKQAYIRWEKAGKRNYTPEKQLVIHISQSYLLLDYFILVFLFIIASANM